MSKKSKKNYIVVVGKTTDNKNVVRGIWKTFETHGFPLDIIFDICIHKNSIPDWISLYEDMVNSGMEHEKILSKLEEAINDSYGKDYSNIIISLLNKIFKKPDEKRFG